MSILGNVKELKYHHPTLWDIIESLNGSILVKAYSIRLKKVKELLLSYAIGQNFALKYANLHDSKDKVVFLMSLSVMCRYNEKYISQHFTWERCSESLTEIFSC